MYTQDVAPSTETVTSRSTTLHGRRDELDRLDDLLRGARRSQSAVLVLCYRKLGIASRMELARIDLAQVASA